MYKNAASQPESTVYSSMKDRLNDKTLNAEIKELFLLVLAEKGSKSAQLDLGVMYTWGKGEVKKDTKKAYKWLEKSYESYRSTSINLGHVSVEMGKYDQAINWYKEAFKSGYSKEVAAAGIAFVYEIKKDYKKAIEWYEKIPDQYAIAEIYESQKDFKTAKEWFKKAADKGNERAKEKLSKAPYN